MLTIRKITKNSPDYPELRRLYRSSFPIQERICLDVYFEDHTGTLDILGFYGPDEVFAGFAIMMSYGDLTQILYFAMEEDLRGRGYGSAAITAMRAYYPAQRIMADVEDPEGESLNKEERTSRMRFYLRNGFLRTEVRFGWEGERYEMLVSRDGLTKDEYNGFWHRAKEERGPDYEVMEADVYSIGMKRGTVQLVTHQSEWDVMAQDACKTIQKALGEAAIDVQHVGSTAIPGIMAKPILDIAVGVNDYQKVLDRVDRLAAGQFILRKDERPRELLFSSGNLENDTITHHVHVVPYGGEEWTNYLNLQDDLDAAREWRSGRS